MTDLMVRKQVALANFGERDDVRELTERIKMMLPGGQKYTDTEARTLAQIAVAHDLDPFNGEVWLIKNDDNGKVYGALVGIKGHRKHAKRQANYWGFGGDGGFTRVVDPARIKAYGASPEDIVFEYRIMDDVTAKSHVELAERFAKIGMSLEEIYKMIGHPPVTLGVGVYVKGERTKMKPVQCAMFRAEKDALKRRFDVKFRVEINGQSVPVSSNGDVDDEPDADEIEAEYEQVLDEPRDEAELMEEIGFGDPEPPANLDDEIIAAAIEAGYTENVHTGRATLKHCTVEFETADQGKLWFKAYRYFKDLGGDTKQAAKHANNGEQPKE